MPYEVTIGLEIHSELKTKSKMFCSCANDPDEQHANINICEVCMGHPGTLPTINEEAIKKLLMVGTALNCKIAEFSKFDRKNYFYPDLPKGYQISQYDLPLCYGGKLPVNGRDIRITRIHMEEDAGRLVHSTNLADRRGLSTQINADQISENQRPDQHESATLVDYNRAGVPLMELVTEPDLKTADDVRRFATELRLILRYLDASEANMEKGQMRVEVNISLREIADKRGLSTRINADQISEDQRPDQRESAPLGTKVEVKNINSISAAGRAVEYEIIRQTELLERGEKIVQETRGWDEDKGKTVSQRIKEGSADYRYFPEPDLPPLRFGPNTADDVRATLPELPQARRERFKRQYGINDAQVEIFTVAKHLGNYYEKVASELDLAAKDIHQKRRLSGDEPVESHINGKLHTLAANYLITEFPGLLKLKGTEVDDIEGIKIEPESFAELMVMIYHNIVSSSAAQTILKEMAETGLHASAIVEQKDLSQVSDESALIEAVEKVISANAKAVEDYRKGKTDVIKYLIGQAMRETNGKANPEVLAGIFKKQLD